MISTSDCWAITMAVVWDKVKRIQKLPVLFVGLATLVVVVILALPGIVTSVAAGALESAGFNRVNLRIEQLGISRATISIVELEYPQGVDPVVINASGLELTWGFGELFSGKIQTLDIDRLEIITHGGEKDSSAFTLPGSDLVFGLLSVPAQEQIPVQRLRADRLLLVQNGSTIATADLTMVNQGGQTIMESRIQTPDGAEHSLNIDNRVIADGGVKWHGVLTKEGGQEALSVEAEYQEGVIDYQVQIAQQALAWLSSGLSARLSFVQLVIDGKLYQQSESGETAAWTGTARMSSPEVVFDDYSAAEISADLQFEIAQSGNRADLNMSGTGQLSHLKDAGGYQYDGITGRFDISDEYGGAYQFSTTINLAEIKVPDDILLHGVQITASAEVGSGFSNTTITDLQTTIDRAAITAYAETGQVSIMAPCAWLA